MSSVANQDGVVYLLTSPSGKQYVGQAHNFNRRMWQYANCPSRHQRILYNAIRKYGWNKFTAEILERGIETQEALDATEDAFIVLLNTMSPHGYNLRRGGAHGAPSDESRALMSASSKARWNRPGEKEKWSAKVSGEGNPFFGKHHTDEARAIISAKNIGKPRSPEASERAAAKNRGRKNTRETINKMRASAKIAQNRPGAREHQSQIQKEVQRRPEVAAKRNQARNGKWYAMRDKHRDEILSLRADGVSFSQIASKIGFGCTTVQRWYRWYK